VKVSFSTSGGPYSGTWFLDTTATLKEEVARLSFEMLWFSRFYPAWQRVL